MDEEIHIGNLIRQKLKEQERSGAWLAKKLYCDRSNIHKILQKQFIDAELLFRISVIMDVNFFDYYAKMFDKTKEKQ